MACKFSSSKKQGYSFPVERLLVFHIQTSQNVHISHYIIFWPMFIQENITLTIHKLSKTLKQNAVHADCASYCTQSNCLLTTILIVSHNF